MATGAPDVVDMIGTAATGFQTDAMAALGVILPVALAVIAAIVLWKFGSRLFKKVGG